jgi:hypothetical protein
MTVNLLLEEKVLVQDYHTTLKIPPGKGVPLNNQYLVLCKYKSDLSSLFPSNATRLR